MILKRIRADDIAAAIAEQIGTYVHEDFIQFLTVDDDRIRCWYMNSGGEGPSFEINLHRSEAGWSMALVEHPSGTDWPLDQ
jgi:hypothetical protein